MTLSFYPAAVAVKLTSVNLGSLSCTVLPGLCQGSRFLLHVMRSGRSPGSSVHSGPYCFWAPFDTARKPISTSGRFRGAPARPRVWGILLSSQTLFSLRKPDHSLPKAGKTEFSTHRNEGSSERKTLTKLSTQVAAAARHCGRFCLLWCHQAAVAWSDPHFKVSPALPCGC